MNCPVCEKVLDQVTIDDVSVDVCRGGCGGIWFDNYELQKFDEPHEAAGESLLGFARDPSLSVDRLRQNECPRCQGVPMMKHFFSIKNEVEVDECPSCGGIWLDAGELAAIRDQFDSEEDRKRAAHEYFDDLLGDEFEEMKAESEAKLDKATRIANLFRFICPSYYIPGKQGWGAF